MPPSVSFIAALAARTLQAVSTWLRARNHILTAILLTVVGAVLTGNGINGLA